MNENTTDGATRNLLANDMTKAGMLARAARRKNAMTFRLNTLNAVLKTFPSGNVPSRRYRHGALSVPKTTPAHATYELAPSHLAPSVKWALQLSAWRTGIGVLVLHNHTKQKYQIGSGYERPFTTRRSPIKAARLPSWVKLSRAHHLPTARMRGRCSPVSGPLGSGVGGSDQPAIRKVDSKICSLRFDCCAQAAPRRFLQQYRPQADAAT